MLCATDCERDPVGTRLHDPGAATSSEATRSPSREATSIVTGAGGSSPRKMWIAAELTRSEALLDGPR